MKLTFVHKENQPDSLSQRDYYVCSAEAVIPSIFVIPQVYTFTSFYALLNVRICFTHLAFDVSRHSAAHKTPQTLYFIVPICKDFVLSRKLIDQSPTSWARKFVDYSCTFQVKL